MPGTRGDLALAALGPGRRGELYADLARTAATLAGMPLLRAGRFVDADLSVAEFNHDLASFVHEVLLRPGGVWSRWSARERDGLTDVVERAQGLLDELPRACLSHGDLHPKNVLADEGEARVVGVVDWEFAHAGHPYTDLGTLLRHARDPDDERTLCRAWCAVRGGDPDRVRDGARGADLLALVDLADRVPERAEGAHAEALLRAVAASGDLHAWEPATGVPHQLDSAGTGRVRSALRHRSVPSQT